MRKILLLIGLVLFIGCSNNFDDIYLRTVYNDTDYDVRLTQAPNLVVEPSDDYDFLVKSKESITVNTRDILIITAEVNSTTNTEKVFGIDFDGDDYKISSFDYWVNYKITGTSNRAALTYSTSGGGTGQIEVDLPYNVGFKQRFTDDFLYISAQNYDSGSLKVEIYVKDRLDKQDECIGSSCIATASSTL